MTQSFRQLVFGDGRDDYIVTCGIKSENHLVELTATLLGGLLRAEEGHLKGKGVPVSGLCLNELGEVVGFIAAHPKGDATAIVVGVNHVDGGGHTILALNTFVVALDDEALIQGIKLSLYLLTDGVNCVSKM